MSLPCWEGLLQHTVEAKRCLNQGLWLPFRKLTTVRGHNLAKVPALTYTIPHHLRGLLLLVSWPCAPHDYQELVYADTHPLITPITT